MNADNYFRSKLGGETFNYKLKEEILSFNASNTSPHHSSFQPEVNFKQEALEEPEDAADFEEIFLREVKVETRNSSSAENITEDLFAESSSKKKQNSCELIKEPAPKKKRIRIR